MVEGFTPVLGHLLQILYFVQMTLWSCWICDLFILSKIKQSELESHPVMGNPCFRFYNLDFLQILLWPTGIQSNNVKFWWKHFEVFATTSNLFLLRATSTNKLLCSHKTRGLKFPFLGPY